MQGKTWKIKVCRTWFQIGDTLNEIEIVPNFFEKKLQHCSQTDQLLFKKDPSSSYYYSESLELVIEDEINYHSSVGEIYYFPEGKYLGINLEDEDFTLCIPRYKIGKLKGNLYQIQTLQVYEQAKLYWQYTLGAENNE